MGNASGVAAAKYNGSIHDAIGFPSNDTIIVDSPPWEVKSCNELLLINAESLKDLTITKNYMEREPAYFTMNAYLINKFKNSSLQSLEESIRMSNLKVEPSILLGSKSCIVFIDKYSSRQFSMCLQSDLQANQILLAFKTFQKCRLGDDLAPYDKIKVQAMISQSCADVPMKKTEDPNRADFGSDPAGFENKTDIPRINATAVRHVLRNSFENAGVSIMLRFNLIYECAFLIRTIFKVIPY